jgi:hypothetical protein
MKNVQTPNQEKHSFNLVKCLTLRTLLYNEFDYGTYVHFCSSTAGKALKNLPKAQREVELTAGYGAYNAVEQALKGVVEFNA